jgi:hypothetical protein
LRSSTTSTHCDIHQTPSTTHTPSSSASHHVPLRNPQPRRCVPTPHVCLPLSPNCPHPQVSATTTVVLMSSAPSPSPFRPHQPQTAQHKSPRASPQSRHQYSVPANLASVQPQHTTRPASWSRSVSSLGRRAKEAAGVVATSECRPRNNATTAAEGCYCNKPNDE